MFNNEACRVAFANELLSSKPFSVGTTPLYLFDLTSMLQVKASEQRQVDQQAQIKQHASEITAVLDHRSQAHQTLKV